MRRSGTVFTAFALIFLVQSAKSQPANLVSLSLSVPQYNQIYVADLDIEHVKSSGILFTATLQSMAATPIQVKLNMSVNITLVGESPFQIAQATSMPLTLNPGQLRVITNVDLSGDNPQIHLESFNYDQQEYDKIKNVALATGKAPAGVYEFVVTCLRPDNSRISNTERADIVVTNPSRVELTFPTDRGTVNTLFPHFQWSSSVDTVFLSVYEKLPNQQSPEDVVSGVPFLHVAVPNPLSPSRGSFNYPPSGPGVRLLQNGKTYYWYVEIPASATRGSGIRSDIWSFTVGTPSTVDTSSVNASNITETYSGNINGMATDALKNVLVGTQWQNLVQQIDILNGNAALDGNHISTEELIRILQSTDKSKIINVIIEQ